VETIIVVILWLIKYLTSFFLTIKSNAQDKLKCSQETFESDSCFLSCIMNIFQEKQWILLGGNKYCYRCVTMSYLRLNMRQSIRMSISHQI